MNGAAAVGGRWNSLGRPVIYLADRLALAQLEKRVHTPLRPPREMVAVEAILPAAAVAGAEGVVLPEGWDADNVDWSVGSTASQRIGDDWLARGTSMHAAHACGGGAGGLELPAQPRAPGCAPGEDAAYPIPARCAVVVKGVRAAGGESNRSTRIRSVFQQK